MGLTAILSAVADARCDLEEGKMKEGFSKLVLEVENTKKQLQMLLRAYNPAKADVREVEMGAALSRVHEDLKSLR